MQGKKGAKFESMGNGNMAAGALGKKKMAPGRLSANNKMKPPAKKEGVFNAKKYEATKKKVFGLK